MIGNSAIACKQTVSNIPDVVSSGKINTPIRGVNVSTIRGWLGTGKPTLRNTPQTL